MGENRNSHLGCRLDACIATEGYLRYICRMKQLEQVGADYDREHNKGVANRDKTDKKDKKRQSRNSTEDVKNKRPTRVRDNKLGGGRGSDKPNLVRHAQGQGNEQGSDELNLASRIKQRAQGYVQQDGPRLGHTEGHAHGTPKDDGAAQSPNSEHSTAENATKFCPNCLHSEAVCTTVSVPNLLWKDIYYDCLTC